MADIIGFSAIVLMGVSLGMFGSGGSVFTIPILVYLFRMEPLIAITHSLFIVGITAFIGGLRYFARGSVHVKTAVFFALPSLVGIYMARHYVLPWLPETIFSLSFITLTKSVLVMIVFAVLMIMAALAMFKRKIMRAENHSRFPPFMLLLTEGFLVGFATGFVGVGGGFLIVPVLVHLLDLPMSTAVGTSLFIIATNTLFAFTVSYVNGATVDLIFTAYVLGAALVGLTIGIFISKIILEDTMKLAFAIVVLLTGSFVLFDQIRTLFTS